MNYILAIVSGILTAIPLVVKLISVVQSNIRERNWAELLDMIMILMEEAEQKFEDGATKKEWVLAMVKASANTINYDIDMNVVSDLIDSLCSMSKTVNAPDDLKINLED